MATMSQMAKPPSALVKLVESVGILLDTPTSFSKSKYKAPSPSNYDSTMDLLSEEFSDLVIKLGCMDSSDVPNDVASKLYSKFIEIGFGYEEAVAAGGLEARDLFNAVMLIMDMLQKEEHRIPIKKTNLLVLVDGTKPSYITLDTAAHLHKHGICTVSALISEESTSIEDVAMSRHLSVDLRRRCKEQYHMSEHTFQVDSMNVCNEGMRKEIQNKMKEVNSNIIVLGIEENFSGTDSLSPIPQWAAWEKGYITVLVKSSSRLQPFTYTNMPRTLQCSIKGIEDLECLFKVCLDLMNPGDHVIFCSVVDSGQPKGDNQQTRFSLGNRQRWIAGHSPPEYPTDIVDWNQSILQDLSNRIDELVNKAQISAKTVLRQHSEFKTVAQEVCAVAEEEEVDMILLRRGCEREVSKEVLADSTCSVILCD